MRKLYAIATIAMMSLTPLSSYADSDVTVLFLKNAGFDTNFDYDKTATGNVAQEILSINNWTSECTATYTIAGVYEFGTAITFNTSGKVPAEGYDGSAGCLALSTGWTQSMQFSQTITLPAGTYKIQAAYYNGSKKTAGTSLLGWVPSSGTSTLSSLASFPLNNWTLDEIEITLAAETKGKVQIGYKAADGASSNSAMIVLDYVKIIHVGDDNIAYPYVASRITNAEKLVSQTMQSKYLTALNEALAAAKALAETATDDEVVPVIAALDAATDAASANITTMSALKALVAKAKIYLTRNMAKAYLNALTEAYEAALAIVDLESDDDIDAALKKLTIAYNNADASYKAYTKLNTKIRTANNLQKDGKEGGNALEAATAVAQAVLDKEDSTPEEMEAATEALDRAILEFRVLNSTGKAPTVKTLTVVSGSTLFFARGTFPSSTLKESGFCYSTEPEPTIFDERTTSCYDNNGNIYYAENLKPATCYYVRAYAVSPTYSVGYGDVVKIYTQPFGTASFSYGYEGDAATNARIYAACEEGVWMWNNVSGIQGFHLDAHYRYGAGAGTGTAECSYGGYMSVSQNTGCQRTGTILHEGAHGLGMVPYTDWTNSIYRANGDRGDWQGSRVDRIIRFLENSTTAKLHGDDQHMWPYGINGSGEDTGSRMLYFGNALLVGALAEDGIRTPEQDFLKPAYSFAQDDDTKYYIKCVDESRGLTTAFLREGNGNQLKWVAMQADEAFVNDSCAWYFTYNPANAYYIITNVATGKSIYYNGIGSNGFRLREAKNSTSNLQLLPTRVTHKSGSYTFAGHAYWITSTNHTSFNALANGNTGSASFDHANTATTQQWLFLTMDEVAAFVQASGGTVGIGGIDTPQHADGQGLTISSGRGELSITALNVGQAVAIYTVDGRLAHRTYIQAEATATIALPRGLYIVNGKKVTVM